MDEGLDLAREEATQFQLHHGRLDGVDDYYVLEYPIPPPLDLSGVDITKIAPQHIPTLVPYFSAIVRRRDTEAVSYYTLGQAPFGGTTLRLVTWDGINANLGPGPEPVLAAFLARLRRME